MKIEATSGDYLRTGGEVEEGEEEVRRQEYSATEIRMAPITAEEKAGMEAKLDAALEIKTIDTETLKLYFKLSTKGKEVRWLPLLCKK